MYNDNTDYQFETKDVFVSCSKELAKNSNILI